MTPFEGRTIGTLTDANPRHDPKWMSFADVGGMFMAGSTLYFVTRSTGDLSSIRWTGTTTTGAPTLIDGPTRGGRNWNGRALFLGNTAPK